VSTSLGFELHLLIDMVDRTQDEVNHLQLASNHGLPATDIKGLILQFFEATTADGKFYIEEAALDVLLDECETLVIAMMKCRIWLVVIGLRMRLICTSCE
jgi:hypothetical protein